MVYFGNEKTPLLHNLEKKVFSIKVIIESGHVNFEQPCIKCCILMVEKAMI